MVGWKFFWYIKLAYVCMQFRIFLGEWWRGEEGIGGGGNVDIGKLVKWVVC